MIERLDPDLQLVLVIIIGALLFAGAVIACWQAWEYTDDDD